MKNCVYDNAFMCYFYKNSYHIKSIKEFNKWKNVYQSESAMLGDQGYQTTAYMESMIEYVHLDVKVCYTVDIERAYLIQQKYDSATQFIY